MDCTGVHVLLSRPFLVPSPTTFEPRASILARKNEEVLSRINEEVIMRFDVQCALRGTFVAR